MLLSQDGEARMIKWIPLISEYNINPRDFYICMEWARGTQKTLCPRSAPESGEDFVVEERDNLMYFRGDHQWIKWIPNQEFNSRAMLYSIYHRHNYRIRLLDYNLDAPVCNDFIAGMITDNDRVHELSFLNTSHILGIENEKGIKPSALSGTLIKGATWTVTKKSHKYYLRTVNG